MTRVLGDAQAAANERLDNAIKNQALQEYRASIDPDIVEALRYSATELVGTEVPSIRRGAQPGEKTRILDSSQARDYIEGAGKLIERGVEDLVNSKQQELKPLRSVIQESFLLFQNNPDIVEGSATFDPELAKRFVKLAASFEFQHQGKTIGYQGNVQPMLNELRTRLASERGASGERVNQQRAEQQRQVAAGQPRTPQGQFQTPQAGIPSTTGMSAAPGEDEDYGAFWQATGAAHLRRGVIPL